MIGSHKFSSKKEQRTKRLIKRKVTESFTNRRMAETNSKQKTQKMSAQSSFSLTEKKQNYYEMYGSIYIYILDLEHNTYFTWNFHKLMNSRTDPLISNYPGNNSTKTYFQWRVEWLITHQMGEPLTTCELTRMLCTKNYILAEANIGWTETRCHK